MSRLHTLKTWPEPFIAIIEGRKHHEIRVNDRGFAVGDSLNLKEWDPTPRAGAFAPLPSGFTGRECWVRVEYITPGGSWGLPSHLCVMSIGAPEVKP